eukprot:GILJ01001694.1.p1 GENE.GILJ01001694.1~~GILJ01001694.1.p1  ORF type:complete len:405 (-),score=59.05 GILJ01001694.1:213-1427(-)
MSLSVLVRFVSRASGRSFARQPAIQYTPFLRASSVKSGFINGSFASPLFSTAAATLSRNHTADHSADSSNKVLVKWNGRSYSLQLPLSSGTSRQLTISPAWTAKDLVNAIKQEDSAIHNVKVETPDGVAWAGSTNLASLLNEASTFVIRMDNKRYFVRPSAEIYIRALLGESQSGSFLQWLDKCKHLGLYNREARIISRFLENLHTTLKLDGVQNTHSLSAKEINDALQRSVVLEGKNEEQRVSVLASKLQTCRDQLAALERVKKELDEQAWRHAHRYAVGGWTILSSQLALYYYGIYEVDWLGWDILEPTTYLVGLGGTVLMASYFKLFKEEYKHETAFGRIMRRKQEKLYQANGFNLAAYHQLQQDVEQLTTKLYLIEGAKAVRHARRQGQSDQKEVDDDDL